ncbi:DNA mismatch repair protein MutS [Weeksellaceae bacterium KMM 9724]|uniref:MutS-related protein n=1 Tax=Profundicola chukchiensis TaxID=2961959 RepID=UPI00243B1791|nr:DNA mismatch repair protein MutS [Profundicola chukchiensis]MDG4950917.1 DNA mismatch repair protein MutS [Profundicola chukchiensis]
MTDPIQFNEAEKAKHQTNLAALKKKLNISSSIRLILFIAIIVGIYFFWSNLQIAIGIGVLGIIAFLILVSRHSNLQYQRDFTKELLEINEKEIRIKNGDYLELNEGETFENPKHFYSYDIDLFGRGSLFQFMNRTVTQEGEAEFAKQLSLNHIENIKQKQTGIKELSAMPNWRQEFSAIGNLVKVQHKAQAIIAWIKDYKTSLPNIMSLLPQIFTAISALLLALVFFDVISYQILMLWFLVGLGISGVYLKKINKIYNEAGKAKDTFSQYYKLLDKIENTTFTSEVLIAQQERIKSENEKASLIFRKFSKTLDSFDQRNNMIMALVGNGFLLWDLNYAFKVEKWLETYHNKVEDWFEVITFFDAQNSLANFAFNHPDYVYPNINQDQNVIKATQLGHPLLKTKKRVDNDFLIENQQFFIITGANMAGKSTFLRTVSLSIVMANMGLPVCAESFDYSPIKLITSMRTSDSLADDESYFFSELKRLKFIVEEIKNDNYFIILDEILKGTNSTDKAIGSKKFVEKLVASNSTGIIATHDLSLCEIENELPEIKNYYFDAEIINDELNFDYRLKNGVCKNMNASFLLKKMEIV